MIRSAQRMRTCLVLLLFILSACRGEKGLDGDPDIPAGASGRSDMTLIPDLEPIIDGQIKEGEWNEAMVFPLDDGSEMFLQITENHLYLAIRAAGGGRISGNVFLEEGETISVLHTSAALGTAIYQEQEGQYTKIKDFEWCCRSRFDSEVSRTAREDFYLAENWLGANSFLGAENELEYKISLPEGAAMLAVNFVYVEGDLNKQTWPVGLDDGVAQEMVGGFPELMEFSIGSWVALEDIK